MGLFPELGGWQWEFSWIGVESTLSKALLDNNVFQGCGTRGGVTEPNSVCMGTGSLDTRSGPKAHSILVEFELPMTRPITHVEVSSSFLQGHCEGMVKGRDTSQNCLEGATSTEFGGRAPLNHVERESDDRGEAGKAVQGSKETVIGQCEAN